MLTGVLGVLYTRASGRLMPPYVQANADQFGTLGIILAISTWLIGFAGIMVAAALVGRVVSEDPTVLRVVRLGLDVAGDELGSAAAAAAADEPAAPR